MTEAVPLSGAAGAAPILSWILSDAAGRLDVAGLMDSFCRQLMKAGVPLFRAAAGFKANHPQVYARGVIWTPETGAEMIVREHGIQFTSAYTDSPIARIYAGEPAIRRRLSGPPEAQEFPILQELRALGATDYLVLPIHFAGAPSGFASFASDRPEGFEDEQVDLMRIAVQGLGLRIETLMARGTTNDLLEVYLGREAARRVLGGEVLAGTGKPIDAIIWVSDLRGFTALADRVPPEELIVALDGYFECTAGAVRRNGGEVLKFIGDGVLGVFPLDSAAQAMAAAREALKRLAALNRERVESGLPGLRTGIGINVGQVIFGNVGAGDRLDFTVIGRAVNETARIETMTKRLDRPLLTSARFAAMAHDPGLIPVGFHALPGVREPVELYGFRPEECPDMGACA